MLQKTRFDLSGPPFTDGGLHDAGGTRFQLAPSLTQTSQQRGIFGLRSAGFETTGLKLKVELVLAQSRAAVSSEQSCC